MYYADLTADRSVEDINEFNNYLDSISIHWLCKLNEHTLKNPTHFPSESNK